ncbi:Aminopeptidase Y [Madurella fahalii]|uniref:Peptide hydrolase n=1 Tax=Madurella fahalii TaxID=1157608 RepID=A0ABQ0GQD2_9PEZI
MALKGLARNGLAVLALSGVAALHIPGQEQIPLTSEVQVGKPLVDSETLQGTISSKNLFSRAKQLYRIAKLSEDEYNHPTRVIGSKGHLGTLTYIYETLSELGGYYTLSKQPFAAVTGSVFESRLVLDQTVPVHAVPMSLTPPTKNKEPVDGNLVLVANEGCQASDYPSNLSGNIAVIRRGTCPFGTKSELAGKAGAVAAIVVHYEDGAVSGTLGEPSPDHVATFSLPDKVAHPFIVRVQAGETVTATAYMDAVVERITTDNIVAQTTQGDSENCVMLGGHSDSVEAGPGINDDGSGSLALLEVAVNLANFSVNNCVRFAWWSAEEEGLLGSYHYVEALSADENKKIRLFMDYDMLASPNFAYQVYDARNGVHPVGSQELRDFYVDWYTRQGLNYTFIAFDGRSDYDGFIRGGIPAGGIATGAEGVKTLEEAGMFGGEDGVPYDVCYHELCDDLNNLNLTAWEVNTKLVAHSVATFARSFDGFPERTVDNVNRAARSTTYQRRAKYRGHRLFI